jgi:hypothetical protein
MIRWRTRRLVNGCAAQKGTVQPFWHRNCMEAKRWMGNKAAINQARVNFSLHFSASHFSAFDAVVAHVEPPVRWSPDCLGPEDSL